MYCIPCVHHGNFAAHLCMQIRFLILVPWHTNIEYSAVANVLYWDFYRSRTPGTNPFISLKIRTKPWNKSAVTSSPTVNLLGSKIRSRNRFPSLLGVYRSPRFGIENEGVVSFAGQSRRWLVRPLPPQRCVWFMRLDAGYLQLRLKNNNSHWCVCDAKEDILAIKRLPRIFTYRSLNSRSVQAYAGPLRHVWCSIRLSTEPTFGDQACFGPTLPCPTYTRKLLTEQGIYTKATQRIYCNDGTSTFKSWMYFCKL